MRRTLALAAVAALLLGSCASAPEPQGTQDSLVSGYITLDFVDGFFNMGPRVLKSGLSVAFEKEGTGETVTARTDSEGLFAFATGGGGRWVLRSIRYEEKVADNTFTGGPNLGFSFDVEPGSIAYIGDLTVVYADPEQTAHSTRGSTKTRSYNYDISLRHTHEVGRFSSYLETKFSESAWLGRPIQEVKLQSN
jgi:opacity protein-like surface antigen